MDVPFAESSLQTAAQLSNMRTQRCPFSSRGEAVSRYRDVLAPTRDVLTVSDQIIHNKAQIEPAVSSSGIHTNSE
jgi:hypothetical protein